MVLKKQGNWCMLLNFHTLNKMMIKYKFPNIIIDDPLDKLHDAYFFTKLDVCSSYHQIQMKEVDIHNTTIHTHEGNYEFLVMHFGIAMLYPPFKAL
jgi:hypothetical protein